MAMGNGGNQIMETRLRVLGPRQPKPAKHDFSRWLKRFHLALELVESRLSTGPTHSQNAVSSKFSRHNGLLCTGRADAGCACCFMLATAPFDVGGILAAKPALLSPTSVALLFHACVHESVRTHLGGSRGMPMVLAAPVHCGSFLTTKLALLSEAPSAFVVNASACIGLPRAGEGLGAVQAGAGVNIRLLHLADLWPCTCVVLGAALSDADSILMAKIALFPTKAVALLFDAGLDILLNLSNGAHFWRRR